MRRNLPEILKIMQIIIEYNLDEENEIFETLIETICELSDEERKDLVLLIEFANENKNGTIKLYHSLT